MSHLQYLNSFIDLLDLLMRQYLDVLSDHVCLIDEYFEGSVKGMLRV